MFRLALIATVSICTLVNPLLGQDTRQAAPDEDRAAYQPVPTIKIASVEFQSNAPLPSKAKQDLTRYLLSRNIYASPPLG